MNLSGVNTGPLQAGDQVKGGAPLFALDVTNEREAAAAAQAQASAAQAQAANLDTGRRPDEIAAIEFLLDKLKDSKTNDEFFLSMKRK